MAFTKIRGPIGGEREDTYAAMVSYFSQPPREKNSLTFNDFLHWIQEADEGEDDTDDGSYDEFVDDKYQ